MSNPNHLPAGIPEGGQFTFAKVGGLAFDDGWDFFSPQQNGSPWVPAVIDASKITNEGWNQIIESLEGMGITSNDLLKEALNGADLKSLSPAERNRLIQNYAQEVYRDGLTSPLARSINAAINQYPEVIVAGGSIVGLAKDDGTFQIGHTMTPQMADIANNMPPLKDDQMIIFNQGTGTMRQGSCYGVPVGKPIVVPAGASADEVNGLISDATRKLGRDLGSDAHAGRMTVGMTKDENGDTVIQGTVLCEANEKGVAEDYAKKFGSEVKKGLKPTDIVNPIAITDVPGMLHTQDMHVVSSNFGGIQAGRMNPSSIPQSSREAMQKLHHQMQEQRSKERGSKARSAEQKQRDLENAKIRRARNKQAIEEGKAGREPVKIKGGWLFKGEKGYDAARAASVDTNKDGVDFKSRSVNMTASEARAAETQAKRQSKLRRDRKYSERKAKINEAKASGKKAVKYYPSGKRRGEVELAVEGDKNYAEALKNPTAMDAFTNKKLN